MVLEKLTSYMQKDEIEFTFILVTKINSKYLNVVHETAKLLE